MTDAWPVLLDDFVDFAREKLKGGAGAGAAGAEGKSA